MYADHILVPIDFSDHSKRALAFAKRYLNAPKTNLSLLHVVEQPHLSLATDPQFVDPQLLTRIRSDIAAQARQELAKLAAELLPGKSVKQEVIDGFLPVGAEIAQFADRAKAGLIVIARHGKGFVSRMILGTVTESLLREAHCPILVLPSDSDTVQYANPQFFKHILVTTDMSEASFRAFDLAAYEAKMNGSQITLLNIIENLFAPVFLHEFDFSRGDAIAAQREYVEGLQAKLNKLAAEKFHGQKVQSVAIEKGLSVASTIVEYASKHSCDLLVLCTRGQGGRSASLIGGVIDRVLRQIHCPALVLG